MPTADPTPVFTKGRDLDATAAALERWLAQQLGVDDVRVGNLSHPSGAGVSNETILFEARSPSADLDEDLVLRTAPAPAYQLFLETGFEMQYELLRVLRRHDTVRVPEVLWYDEDPTWFGQPFFVMRRLHGRVPVSMPVYNSGGWLFDATPAQRRRAWESAVGQLAAIHLVPADLVQVADMSERGPTGTSQQLSYWTEMAERVFGDDVPATAAELLGWLRANEPAGEEPGLAWGDARIGNMVFGDDFEVVGVLDWEQASLAGAMEDLGWWLYFDEMHSTYAGLERLEGLGTREETIELWQQLTGRTVGDIRWHEVFAGLKVALLALRTAQVFDLQSMSLTAGMDQYLRPSRQLAGLADPA